MKKYSRLIIGLLGLTLILWSCEGPIGQTGANGIDGLDGQDANETCKKCHSSLTDVTAKMSQAKHSKHMSGEAWLEGTRNNCAPCHSQEGFLDVVKKSTAKQSYTAAAAALASQSPIGCGTCHKIHQNYDSTDFTLSFSGPVDMLIDTARTRTLALDLGNSSNLCMKCHQPRIVKQMDFAGAPTTSYTGIAYRFGPHYGTVGAIFGGKGAFEIAGTSAYTNSAHTAQASCATCHMADQNGLAGGHTFYAKNEETGAINTKGCVSCHTNTTTLGTLITSTQTEIKTLLNQLGAKLDEIGGATGGILQKDEEGLYTGYIDVYDAGSNPGAKFKTSTTTTVTLPNLPTINNKQAAAIVNFQLVLRDKSMGVHNYSYTKALLSNSLAALQ